jgi:hypothetical protein
LPYAGYSDWRLPDTKELQSIVDYTRSPATTSSAAINPIFNCTQITNEGGVTDYPWYWSSTTFSSQSQTNGASATYVCFGRAMGYFPGLGWTDIHGAGCQRSDPKPRSFSGYTHNGNGYYHAGAPQGDAVRIYNYVRLVRDISGSTGVDKHTAAPSEFGLEQNYPNPFNPSTTISFSLPAANHVSLKIYDLCGKQIATLVNGRLSEGSHSVQWQAENLPSDVYFSTLEAGSLRTTKKMILTK